MSEWTTTPPYQNGFYWIIFDLRRSSVVHIAQVLVEEDLVLIEGEGRSFPMSEVSHWLGPIPVPEGPKE